MTQFTKTFTINQIEINNSERSASKGGRRLPIEPKALRLLNLLASNEGNVISTAQIRREIWDDVCVCRHAIYRTISHLRKVFKALDADNEYIQTISKGGYRLLGEVDLRASYVNLAPSQNAACFTARVYA